jgi:Cu(I)/Ag(I) efflux system membrane protein CusA/SilA
MRPLATPVIGGMVSSFLHILIVTPVLFAWLREREMTRAPRRLQAIRREQRIDVLTAA